MTTIISEPANRFADRTSLEVAFHRLGLDAPSAQLYDDDEDTLFYGYDPEPFNAVIRMLTAANRRNDDVILLKALITRSELYDGAVWFDTDRRALIALLLNRVADSGVIRPVIYTTAAERRTLRFRLKTLLRR